MYKIILASFFWFQGIQVSSQAITAYSGIAFSGEEYLFDSIGDFDIPPYIDIKSIRVPDNSEFMVSFDFNSSCNSLESGPLRFFSGDLMDIYSQYACDRDFSRIRKIFIRPNMENYKDKTVGFLYSEPYYMGKMVKIKAGGCPDISSLGLDKISSFQIPSGYSIVFYKGLKFDPKRDRSLGRRVQYSAGVKGALTSYAGVPLPGVVVKELEERTRFYDLTYILDRWESNLQFLKIKSVKFYNSVTGEVLELVNPELNCTLLMNSW